MQSNSQIWCKNVGCALLTLRNVPIQSGHMTHIHSYLNNLSDFYNTSIYQLIQSQFQSQNITLLNVQNITNAPNILFLSTKIYCFTNENKKCMFQFPVFLTDKDILKLQNANLYELFPEDQIWLQYYYSPYGDNAYKICDNIVLKQWHEVINLSPYIMIVRNTAGNEMFRSKVINVAFTELCKSPSYEYSVKQMSKYAMENGDCFLVISMSVGTNNRQSHFAAIINEVNRHLLNNINDRQSKYKASELRNHMTIDYKTDMCQTEASHEWNVPKDWHSSSHSNHSRNIVHLHKEMDLFGASLSKVVHRSQSQSYSNSYHSYSQSNYTQYNQSNYKSQNQNQYSPSIQTQSNCNPYKQMQYQNNNENNGANPAESNQNNQQSQPRNNYQRYDSNKSVHSHSYQNEDDTRSHHSHNSNINKPQSIPQRQVNNAYNNGYEYSDSSDDNNNGYNNQYNPANVAQVSVDIKALDIDQKSSTSNYNSSPTHYNVSPDRDDQIKDEMIEPISDNTSVVTSSFQPGALDQKRALSQCTDTTHTTLTQPIQYQIEDANVRHNSSQNSKDYRGYVLQKANSEKYELIIDIDHRRETAPYKVIDCDDSVLWKDIESYKFYMCVDIIDFQNLLHVDRVKFLTQLTTMQIAELLSVSFARGFARGEAKSDKT